MSKPNLERIAEYFEYEPDTGTLIWRKRKKGTRIQSRTIAGWTDWRGDRWVTFEGKTYAQHRIAWLLGHGEWPPFRILHINGHPGDNRLDNLAPGDI
jgi:hypothetical protein